MAKHEDFSESTKELIADLYYDGLVNDKLHALFIDEEELVVIPAEFPDITGEYLKDALDWYEELDSVRQYTQHNNIPMYTVDDLSIELIKDYDTSLGKTIQERFVEDYIEEHLDSLLNEIDI